MTTTVAELRAVVTADISGLERNLNAAKTQVQGFGTTMGSLGRDASAFGNQMMIATAPIAIGFGAGIKVAADFEASLAEISARTGVTGRDLKKVGDFALEMGRKTIFSAQDASDGLLQLMSSGQSLEEAMATLPDVMNLAAASGENLGFTADAVTDIMAQFGLSIDMAASVTDVLAKAAGASSADVAGLADGFANVGPVAATMGMSVWETASALAVLAENGIKGAEAGTALKSALLHMTSPDGVKLLKDHGVAMYDLAGNARPIPDVLNDIKDAMKDMTDQEKIKFLTDLGGAYGVVALTALTGDLTIGDMNKKMHDSATAAEIAEGKMNTLNTKLDTLKGTVEALATEAFTPFIENNLKPFVEYLDTAAQGAGEWVKQNPELTGQLLNMGVVLLLVGPMMKVLGAGFTLISGLVAAGGPLLTGLSMYTAAMWAALAPIAPFIAGAAALAAAYLVIENAAKSAQEKVDAATEAITQSNVLPEAGFLVAGDTAATGGASTGAGYATYTIEASGELEALAMGGLSPSEALAALAELGVPPDTTLQELVNQGILPSEVLSVALEYGLGPTATLQDYFNNGLAPSQYLQALLAQGLRVTVDINTDGSATARPVRGPRAKGGGVEAGETYEVGEEGRELFVPESDGYILPTGSYGGMTFSGPIHVYGVENVEQFYNKLQREAKKRGHAFRT